MELSLLKDRFGRRGDDLAIFGGDSVRLHWVGTFFAISRVEPFLRRDLSWEGIHILGIVGLRDHLY